MASLPNRMQGAQLPNLSITWKDEDGNARTLSGAITGFMTLGDTTKAITGTLTADADQATNQGVFAWDISAADVATAGRWSVYFVETIATESYKSEPVSWAIITAPTA